MDEQEQARLERMRAVERLTDDVPKTQRVRVEKDFTFSEHAANRFRYQLETLRQGAHPRLTQSQMIELLVSHWYEHQPDSQWVLDFEFVTKLGRPRASS